MATTTTGANPQTGLPGWYHFDVDCGKKYVVKIGRDNFKHGGPLEGALPTLPNRGPDTVDSDGILLFSPFVIVESGDNPTIDFGFVSCPKQTPPPPPTKCGLGDFVWNDANKNGIQDDGSSSGTNGVVVDLIDANGKVVATATTANDPASGRRGWYHFSVECGKKYRVKIDYGNFSRGKALDNFQETSANRGHDDARDSDGSDLASPYVVVTSGDDPTIDFGFVNCKRW